jgi:hypothetical protein
MSTLLSCPFAFWLPWDWKLLELFFHLFQGTCGRKPVLLRCSGCTVCAKWLFSLPQWVKRLAKVLPVSGKASKRRMKTIFLNSSGLRRQGRGRRDAARDTGPNFTLPDQGSCFGTPLSESQSKNSLLSLQLLVAGSIFLYQVNYSY